MHASCFLGRFEGGGWGECARRRWDVDGVMQGLVSHFQKVAMSAARQWGKLVGAHAELGCWMRRTNVNVIGTNQSEIRFISSR
jgi:hypothetical protein